MLRIILCASTACALFASAHGDELPNLRMAPADAPSALYQYVGGADDSFEWAVESVEDTAVGSSHYVKMTSQTWQGIRWEHDLLICSPPTVQHPKHVLMVINGGSNSRRGPRESDAALGRTLAALTGARVALLFQVPNQPLMGDKYEDDLITETWLKYLETGDDSWPLLFPMVKSAVRAMDTVQQLGSSEWDAEIDSFVLTGASKRGWTSWLTPVADKRVVGTIPLVIDTLNFRGQMRYQHATWGFFSEQIEDYTRKGLINTGEESPREIALRRMMDPWTYRKELSLPKLLVCGTNDPYWVADAMNNYWDDLIGPKYILQIPNGRHGLEGGVDTTVRTSAVFFRSLVTDTPLPQLSWSAERDSGDKSLSLTVSCDQAPTECVFWSVTSADRDLRDDRWVPLSSKSEQAGGKYQYAIDIPESGDAALMAELRFGRLPLQYSLTTQVYRAIRTDATTTE